jgi:putative peptidoglycan binding protein/N-acetylmuramoyl-L-alanine amidase-like protein
MQIITRAQWGARYADGAAAGAVPSREWWLHHTATIAPDLVFLDANRDGVDDDEAAAMRTLEKIGQERFHAGISYTWLLPPSGRIYQGHTMGRQGTHTGGHNTRARAISLIGNYDVAHVSDAQIEAAATILVTEHRAGRAATHQLDGGHRDLKSTDCPGRFGYAAIGPINSRARELWAGGGAPSPAPPPPAAGGAEQTVLRRGSKGPAVRKLQTVLAAWYPQLHLAVDGDYGPATEAAVRHLQGRAEIVVDGIAGPATLRELGLSL